MMWRIWNVQENCPKRRNENATNVVLVSRISLRMGVAEEMPEAKTAPSKSSTTGDAQHLSCSVYFYRPDFSGTTAQSAFFVPLRDTHADITKKRYRGFGEILLWCCIDRMEPNIFALARTSQWGCFHVESGACNYLVRR